MVTMASMSFGYELFHTATETAEQQLQYGYSCIINTYSNRKQQHTQQTAAVATTINAEIKRAYK